MTRKRERGEKMVEAGRAGQKSGATYEDGFENLLKKHRLKYRKKYKVFTMVGRREIDFVIFTEMGRVLVECKYRETSEASSTVAYKIATESLFTVMYELYISIEGNSPARNSGQLSTMRKSLNMASTITGNCSVT